MPEVGRFISKDPIGLLRGLNGYAYAPNPVSWVDPLGLAKTKKPNTCKKNSSYQLIRYMSMEEAIKVQSAGGLVKNESGPKGAKKPNRKAVWVNEATSKKQYNPQSSNIRVVFTLSQKGQEMIKENSIYDDSSDGETKNPKQVQMKTNEPGALGIGTDLLQSINQEIVSLCIQKKGQDKKWK